MVSVLELGMGSAWGWMLAVLRELVSEFALVLVWVDHLVLVKVLVLEWGMESAWGQLKVCM